VDADQDRFTCLQLAAVAVRPVGTEGATVSAVLNVLALATWEYGEALPEDPIARILKKYVVAGARLEALYETTSRGTVATSTNPVVRERLLSMAVSCSEEFVSTHLSTIWLVDTAVAVNATGATRSAAMVRAE
jgi:hypothetical protein